MHRYNLQPLMNRDFTVTNVSSIKLRVCGALTDSTCRAGTGTIYILPIAYIIIVE